MKFCNLAFLAFFPVAFADNDAQISVLDEEQNHSVAAERELFPHKKPSCKDDCLRYNDPCAKVDYLPASNLVPFPEECAQEYEFITPYNLRTWFVQCVPSYDPYYSYGEGGYSEGGYGEGGYYPPKGKCAGTHMCMGKDYYGRSEFCPVLNGHGFYEHPFYNCAWDKQCDACGDCDRPHRTKGCSNDECRRTICSIRWFRGCCKKRWGKVCSFMARWFFCTDCGGKCGDCGRVHNYPGCSNEGCKATVCSKRYGKFCCNKRWDRWCVWLSIFFCKDCIGTKVKKTAVTGEGAEIMEDIDAMTESLGLDADALENMDPGTRPTPDEIPEGMLSFPELPEDNFEV